MLFSALCVGGLSFAMIRAAKAVRGRVSYSDAFFPLLMLNWSHTAFRWSIDLMLVMVTALSGVILLIMIRSGSRWTLGSAILAGVCTILLPGCAASGLVLLPALALWQGYCGVLQLRTGQSDRRPIAMVLMTTFAASLLILPMYFIHYRRGIHEGHGLFPVLAMSARVWNAGFGRLLGWLWPYSAIVLPAIFLAVAVALVAGRALPADRPRAIGLLLFLGAYACLAVVIGWGRGAFLWEDYFDKHYAIVMAPALCWLYLASQIYCTPAASRLVGMFLFAASCGVYAASRFRCWWSTGYGVSTVLRPSGTCGGMAPSLLVERHVYVFLDTNEEPLKAWVIENLEKLRRAGIGPYRLMGKDPLVEGLSLPVTPAAVEQMIWNDGVGYAIGSHPSVVFALPEARRVDTIRLRCSYQADSSIPGHFRMSWQSMGRGGAADPGRDVRLTLDKTRSEQSVVIKVNDIIDRFRIEPDDVPCAFRISQITLLVPPGERTSGPPRSAATSVAKPAR